MLGELSVGHLYVGGGASRELKRLKGGLLGADYTIENGRYRFARVYNGENWNPQTRAPLTQPGVNVVAGEYLLAVNGRELRGSDNIYSFFEETAGKSVVLRVGPDPNGANAREVTVVPVDNEFGLRNLVVDPVMIAASGDSLMQHEAAPVMRRHLFPLATVVTPNLDEATFLCERKIRTVEEM